MALKKSQKSLKRWTKQKWRTPSGKPSGKTGEVYAPSKTIKHQSQLLQVERNLQQLTERSEKLLRKVSNTLDMVYIKEKNDERRL